MKRWKSATRGRFADVGRDAHAGEVQDVLHQRSDLEFGEKQHWKAYVKHLGHHLQAAFQRGVFHRLVRVLVEDLSAFEVLHREHCHQTDQLDHSVQLDPG